MKALLLGFCLILTAVILTGCDKFLTEAKVGLQITSQPTTVVYLNDQKVGSTPYNSFDLKPGEFSIKLASGSANWSGQVKLNPGTISVVNRVFESDEGEASGEVLTMEKGSGITLISIPDNVEVTIDSSPVGSTPVNLKDIPIGSHRVVLSKDGYLKRAVQVQTHLGFSTLVNVQLAKEKVKPSLVPAQSAIISQIEVLQTPTGWLRVRTDPSFGGREISKINAGEKYPLLAEQADWVKIQLPGGEAGWVSAQFVKKVP